MHRIVLVVALVLAPYAADAGPPKKKAPIAVAGVYSSTYDEVRLDQHGSIITGEYACCGGGSIEGRITGRVIKYHWRGEDGTEGNGVWTVVAPGVLRGTWGSDDSEDDGGEWNLDRVRDADQIAN